MRRPTLPSLRQLRTDAVAGLPGAIGSVPDGMAASILAGVNPIHGLYASIAGPTVGGMTASTRLMVITTTSAAALAAGSALQGVPAADRSSALFLLTFLAGAAMVVAGLLKLGRYTRFVTQSVMIGFLTGVAANIIFGQLQDLTGTDADGEFAAARALDVALHPGEWHLPSLVVGVSAIGIVILVSRTKLASFAALLALVIPTAVATLLDATGIATVADVGAIPSGLPMPQLPEFRHLSLSLVSGALAIAAIILVQGAGVAESAPNRDRSVSDPDQDFRAQGLGNIASAFLQGQPVGGSVGQTALNVAAGAQSRWASIFSGIWMIVILVAFSGVVGKVIVPTLAGVLIIAAFGALRPGEAAAVWRTGGASRIAMTTTFIATLVLPVAAAVGIGVALALLMQLNQEAIDLKVVELYRTDDGKVAVRDAPEALRSGEVTVLTVYGSLMYAGSRTLQAKLPTPAGTVRPAVVLRMRGRTTLGATFFLVLQKYLAELAEVDGSLTLTGLEPSLVEQLRRTGRFDVSAPLALFPATEVMFQSTERGYRAAESWLITAEPTPPTVDPE